jgi:site-specific recombinase XerD
VRQLVFMAIEQRLRDYLTRDEVALLLRAAKKIPRHGARNHAMILIAYRHGLRASELVNLRRAAQETNTFAANGLSAAASRPVS